MSIPDDLDGLTALFERLGAREPASWAKSQIEEGIPQLMRFLFLRQAWRDVVDEGDRSWVDGAIRDAKQDPSQPYASVGLALQRCLDKGVDAQDLTDIVRGMQAQLLFALCYRLDDPGLEEPELADVAWGLFAVDREGNPVPPAIGGLHESVLETDPTDREMRPR